jgi:hypothetical protein
VLQLGHGVLGAARDQQVDRHRTVERRELGERLQQQGRDMRRSSGAVATPCATDVVRRSSARARSPSAQQAGGEAARRLQAGEHTLRDSGARPVPCLAARIPTPVSDAAIAAQQVLSSITESTWGGVLGVQ